MSLYKWFLRQLDKLSNGPFRELENSGNWRVRYADGRHSRFMCYSHASNLAAVHGGRLLHRNEQEQPR